jgi:ABC-type Na+ efflux pump permease subunit
MGKIVSLFLFSLQSIMTVLLLGGVLTATGLIDLGLKDIWLAKEKPTVKVAPSPVKVVPNPITGVDKSHAATKRDSAIKIDSTTAALVTTKSGN